MGLVDLLLTRRKDYRERIPTQIENRPTSRISHSPLRIRSISPFDMNTSSSRLPSTPVSSSKMRASNGTIRSVPREAQQLDVRAPGEDQERAVRTSPRPRSQSPPQMSGKPPSAWQNSKQLGVGNILVRKLSSEFGPSKHYAGNVHVVENTTTSTNGDSHIQESGGGCSCGHVCGRGVGGGKSTSSFIEKVMSEREFYKREFESERLKTQEANDALNFLKARMEKLISDHETEMHEANMNRTLLKRKERQLDDMKGKIDIEKQRALAAAEQEKVWKRDMDAMEEQCRKKVEAAENHAGMVENQNNVMVRHWKKKQAEIDKREAAMLKTHEEFLLLVRKESEKSKRVMAICDQYRAENDRVTSINEAQKEQHSQYKATSEASLQGIRLQGAEFGEKADAVMKDVIGLRDKLAWSLQVSKDFKDIPSPVDKLP